jgi:hypothetical protein
LLGCIESRQAQWDVQVGSRGGKSSRQPIFELAVYRDLIFRLRQNASDVNRIETSRNLSVKACLQQLP